MKTHALVLAVGFAAAGCSNGPIGDVSEELSGRFGIDYAWGRPAPSSIRADGYGFAARYLSYDTTGKNLTAGEADRLRRDGVDVLVVWEAGATDALSGRSLGESDAREAEKQAADCGEPAGRPIYFAVDFDATPGDQGAIDAYFDGVASVIGRERTGAYAGYWVIKRLFDAGKIKYGWQTYAWSGGFWDVRAQLRQVLNGIRVDGVDSDRDEAVAADFGQWGYQAPPPADDGQRIVVGHHPDGRIEVFDAAAGTGALDHKWELPGSGWSPSDALGGAARSLAVAENADGRIELFYVGTDDVIYHNFQVAPDGGWYGQVPLGGRAKRVAAARNADGRLELFYIGTDDALYHDFQKQPNGDWSGQHLLGGKAKELAVESNADGRLELFYVGTNDELYHDYQTSPGGGWHGEARLDGKGKQLAAARNADGRLELFYVGTNDALYHDWQDRAGGGWSGEHELGGKAKRLAVANDADGELALFYIGTDDALYRNFQTSPGGGWSGQRALGGWAKQLAVGVNRDGRLEIFYIGTNDALYHNWQDAADGSWYGEHEF